MTAKTKKILTILLTILGLTAFVVTPLAWFSSYWLSGLGSVTSNYTDPDMPGFDMWMYLSAEEASSGQSEGWKSVTATTNSSDRGIKLPNVEVDDAKSTYEYKYESLHFGKLDNLVDIREDNKVYMRLAFNTETHGDDFITIRLSYNTAGYNYTKGQSVLDSFYLYKMYATPSEGQEKITAAQQDLYNIDPLTKGHIVTLYEDEPNAMKFVQYRYAISPNAYESPDVFLADGVLTFSDSIPINCGRALGTCSCNCTKDSCTDCSAGDHEKCSACTACNEGTCGSITLEDPVEGMTLTNDTYYLYIEISPLIDAFGMQENILDYFVPSYMLFDVKFEIEIG